MIEVKGEGYTIDCDYLINVKDMMELAFLPVPRRRLHDTDGTRLPLISVDIGGMQ